MTQQEEYYLSNQQKYSTIGFRNSIFYDIVHIESNN